VPNKLTTDLKEMILGALSDVGGREYLAQQARQNPAAFLTLIGKVLPTQLAGDRENPIRFVIRGPSPVDSADEWLRLHAPADVGQAEVVIEGEAADEEPDESPPPGPVEATATPRLQHGSRRTDQEAVTTDAESVRPVRHQIAPLEARN
jgi:hypothetical protein